MYSISWYIRNMVEVDIDIKLPLLYYGGINSITVIARIIFSIIVLILTMIITMFTMLATVLFLFFFLNRYSQEDGTVSSYLQNSEKFTFHIWGLPVMWNIYPKMIPVLEKNVTHWALLGYDMHWSGYIFTKWQMTFLHLFLSLKDYYIYSPTGKTHLTKSAPNIGRTWKFRRTHEQTLGRMEPPKISLTGKNDDKPW